MQGRGGWQRWSSLEAASQRLVKRTHVARALSCCLALRTNKHHLYSVLIRLHVAVFSMSWSQVRRHPEGQWDTARVGDMRGRAAWQKQKPRI